MRSHCATPVLLLRLLLHLPPFTIPSYSMVGCSATCTMVTTSVCHLYGTHEAGSCSFSCLSQSQSAVKIAGVVVLLLQPPPLPYIDIRTGKNWPFRNRFPEIEARNRWAVSAQCTTMFLSMTFVLTFSVSFGIDFLHPNSCE